MSALTVMGIVLAGVTALGTVALVIALLTAAPDAPSKAATPAEPADHPATTPVRVERTADSKKGTMPNLLDRYRTLSRAEMSEEASASH